MKFSQLQEEFHNYSLELAKSKDPSAKFRAASYERVANKMELEYKSDETVSKEKINSLEISDYMKSKAVEVYENGGFKPAKSAKSAKSPREKTTKETKTKETKTKETTTNLIKELTEFMGIGEEKAKALIEAGVKHVNQLHMKKYKDLLPEETKMFIDLKPMQTIPREDIMQIEPYIMQASKGLKLMLVGSYRREKPTSSDIDVMVISDKENAIEKLLENLKSVLNDKVYPYSKGKDKMSLIVDFSEFAKDKPEKTEKTEKPNKSEKPTKKKSIVKTAEPSNTDFDDTADLQDKKTAKSDKIKSIKSEKSTKKIYKIDAFRTTKEDSIPMLLYSTGSKEFNVSMRSKAKKLGYLLNQKGLFKDGEKVPNLKTEKDYFDILQMEYKEPKFRM